MTAEGKPVEEAITIAGVEASLEEAAKCVAELLRVARRPPAVDKNGFSEYLFAAELYAKKAEAEQCLEKLGTYRRWLGNEIRRCENNLEVLSTHQDMLNTDRPRKYFSEAQSKLAALYKRLLKLQEKVEQMIKKIQDALCKAAQKQYPSNIPQKDRYSSLASPAFEQPLEQDTSDIDRDLRQMLMKGPIG